MRLRLSIVAAVSATAITAAAQDAPGRLVLPHAVPPGVVESEPAPPAFAGSDLAPRRFAGVALPRPEDEPRSIVVAGLVVYQDRRGPEQTERLSRRIRIGANGRLTLANVAGDIVVTGGSGDEVVVEAVKRTRGDRDDLASVEIDIEERPGRVEVRTRHTGRRDRTAVDFTVSVPAGTEVDVSSVSGSVRVSSVRGTVRARSVSGNVTTAGSPRVEVANSVSGDVDLADVSSDGDLNVGSVSGDIRARGVKARALDLSTVSGRIDAADVTCDRLRMKSVSGDLDFTGTLARNGRYEVNSHSGDVRMAVPENSGFELDATTFSGSIDSELPAKLTGASSSDDRRRRGRTGRTTRAVVGDGTAVLTIATFSGDILIRRR